MANDKEIVLIDLSSIAHPIWHMSQAEPDPNATSQKIVARIRALAGDRPHVAVCCDAGRSFRKDIAPSYKANRPEHDAPLMHQIDLARERLEADGFPIWRVPSFEADDLIATATMKALAADLDVLIVSADKDLLQLVGPRVRAMSVRDGSILGEAEVVAKFGVKPGQVRDYLCLVGDSSDNIKGAQGIGPKKAAELLQKYDSLDIIYGELQADGTQFKPALATALKDFQSRLSETRQLVSLRIDAEIPFEQIASERTPRENPVLAFDVEDDMQDEPTAVTVAPSSTETSSQDDASLAPSVPNGGDSGQPSTAIAIRDADQVLPAPTDWERGLDPRSMKDARILAKDMYESRMFSAYGTPQAVLSTVMVGRELGLPAMASLRSVHVIEGKHALSADLMVALVLKSGLAEYFEPIAFNMEHAIFETLRKGARKPITLEYTIAHAKLAGLVKKDSGWEKRPEEMLIARAKSRLARLVYPDLLAGLYTPEELREAREAERAA